MEHLQAKMKNLPQIKYASVLVDEKNASAQLITFDPLDNFVQIQRVNDIKEGPNDSMQLRAIPTAGKPSYPVNMCLAPRYMNGMNCTPEISWM